MSYRNIILFFIFFIITSPFEGQKGDEMSPYQEYLLQLKEYRKNCRNALKPYRYDGSLTTHFSYKEYTYVKEIEIATIQNEIYRLSFNAMGIMDDGITIKIYDKPKKYNKRTLLYEKENVTGSEFTIETNEMIDKFKQAKREQGYEEKVVTHLRLKKLFIDYIIPAKDRVFETNDEDGSETKVITKGAVILAVGYNNL
tara:strand:+ start:6276 stop:6869 length:594 start_codon:yes stop_codon:yes gene_type:complete